MSLFALLVLILGANSSYGSGFSDTCHYFYKKQIKPLSKEALYLRDQIIQKNHRFTVGELLDNLKKDGKLIYKGSHKYQAGSEFLASNEFDWAQTPKDYEKTDIIIGFGTNSVWDLALRKKAEHIIIGDWSPWPIIAQAYLVAPLLRISKTPQEFIYMLNGLPSKFAYGKSLSDVFNIGKNFSLSRVSEQRTMVEMLLVDLANNPLITEKELQFLTTYFRPRLGDNLNPSGYGPFENLRSPQFALVSFFYDRRYNPQLVGEVDSIFSSIDNFNYLKSKFDGDKVKYGLTSITDLEFYKTVSESSKFPAKSKVTFSVSNVFDCGCYNGLTFFDFQKYLKSMIDIFKNPITVFRTTNSSPPHGFYRYFIPSKEKIPSSDEIDSTAINEKNKAG